MDEWINKLAYIHTAEHQSAIKSNQLLIHRTTQIISKQLY